MRIFKRAVKKTASEGAAPFGHFLFKCLNPGFSLKRLFFRSLLLAFLLDALGGCIAPPIGGIGGGYRSFSRSEEDYDARRRNDLDRDSVLSRSRDRHSGRSRCSNDSDCQEICDDIYDRRKDREDCESLPIGQVEALKEVYEALEDPDEDDLEDVDSDDFDVLVNINIKPLDKLVGKYRARQAKEILRWIASDSDIANVFQKEDDDFEILKELFEKIDDDLETSLKTTIDSGQVFLDIVSEESNEEAGEWIHELIEEELCNRDLESAACLKKYCAIAKKMDRDTAEDMLSLEYFEDYLDDIIDSGINCAEWAAANKNGKGDCSSETTGSDPFEEASDLDDDWWNELCS